MEVASAICMGRGIGTPATEGTRTITGLIKDSEVELGCIQHAIMAASY